MKHCVHHIVLLCLFCILGQLNHSFGQSDLSEFYKEAKKYSEQKDDIRKADSLSQEAVQRAKASLNKDLVYESMMKYLTRDEFGYLPIFPQKYLDIAVDLSETVEDPDRRFELWIVLSKQLLHQQQLENGSDYARRALSYAASSPSPRTKAKAYLAAARAARANNKIKEGWQNILNAQNFIEKVSEKDRRVLQSNLNDEMIDFHKVINDHEKVKNLIQNKLNTALEAEPVDSTKYMWTLFDLCVLLKENFSDIRIDNNVQSLIKYAHRNNNKTLLAYTDALNRNYLINNFRLAEFFNQYSDKYDKPLSILKSNSQTAEYCLSNALFCEYKRDLDSAKILYERAILAANAMNHDYRKANYHRRYGEFLYRHGMEQEAYSHLNQALSLAKKNNYISYILDVVEPLDTLAKKFNDYEAAYSFAETEAKAKEFIANQQMKENLLIMELENEKKQNELRQISEAEQEKKKFNLQYFAIAIGLITLFLLLVILSSMSVPEWLIEMMGFFSILFIFEFVILILDHKIHHWAHGEPIKIFLVKIAILSVLFPFHHVIEHGVTSYMKKNQLLKRPKKGFFRNILEKLYPWMSEENKTGH